MEDKREGRVLLVDDMVKEELTSVVRALTRLGYDVHTSETAVGAFAILKEIPIDVVITDYHMPFVDGLELFHRIRAKFPEMPVIMITGVGSVDVAVEFMKSRGTDFLSKPVNLNELDQKIRRAVGISMNHELAHLRKTLEVVKEHLNLASANSRTIFAASDRITGNEAAVREIHASSRNLGQNLIAAIKAIESYVSHTGENGQDSGGR
ncbi:MAG: response regulator [Magnetococcales bacterium]|nr:response regulator [Magnetococcales bacterium]MBF0150812.1 response regulator [Magnetococcales bacterium]MBF0175210.1 response regulator [Magnetococcales bacterium]MBF0629679.1 response regulator [Magnetococcales bacterium]